MQPSIFVIVTVTTVEGEILERNKVEYCPEHDLPIVPQQVAARIMGSIDSNSRLIVHDE
jgi:hypothetical protein